jgi:N-acetylmuramoyl-L-alanine amidase
MLLTPLLLALTAWPADGTLAVRTELPLATSPHKLRVAIDAGHGAPNNHGNHGCYGQLEEDHTLAVAQHLAFVLLDLGRFEVTLLRKPGETPRYQDRIARAERWGAEVIVSLHSDERGELEAWSPAGPDAGARYRSTTAPGFSVLWSDRGERSVARAKERLGRLVGASLRASGFVPYSGADYGELYRQDPVEPSGWIDVRPLGKDVYFLRASAIPTVIIETHHALDPAEVARWEELTTLDALALALAQALLAVHEAK